MDTVVAEGLTKKKNLIFFLIYSIHLFIKFQSERVAFNLKITLKLIRRIGLHGGGVSLRSVDIVLFVVVVHFGGSISGSGV